GQRRGVGAPPLAVEEEDEPQAAGLVQAHLVLDPVVLPPLLGQQLEDPPPHLLVGVAAVLVLHDGQGARVEDDDALAAAVGQLAGEVGDALEVGGDRLGHGAVGPSVGTSAGAARNRPCPSGTPMSRRVVSSASASIPSATTWAPMRPERSTSVSRRLRLIEERSMQRTSAMSNFR